MPRQTSLQMTPATDRQVEALQKLGFGTFTDIVRIAIDRMYREEAKMQKVEWNEYIDRMFARGKVQAFHVAGDKGSILQAESGEMSIDWDSVSGTYLAGGIEFANEPGDLGDTLFERINKEGEWVDEPLFWVDDSDPEEYVGA